MPQWDLLTMAQQNYAVFALLLSTIVFWLVFASAEYSYYYSTPRDGTFIFQRSAFAFSLPLAFCAFMVSISFLGMLGGII